MGGVDREMFVLVCLRLREQGLLRDYSVSLPTHTPQHAPAEVTLRHTYSMCIGCYVTVLLERRKQKQGEDI